MFCSDFLVGVKLEKTRLNLYRSFVGLVVERAKGLPKLFSDMNHNHNHTRGHRYIEYVLLTDLLSKRTVESTYLISPMITESDSTVVEKTLSLISVLRRSKYKSYVYIDK